MPIFKPNPLHGRFLRRGEEKASNANIANLITIARILLAPLFVYLLLLDAGELGPIRIVAAVLFIVAIATDGLDGHLARSRNLVTNLGIILDPIADKVLIGGALVTLSILGELWWWVTIVILLRELGITVYRFVALRDRVIPASRGGKAKTMAQAWAIGLLVLPLSGAGHATATAIMYVALVLTLATGFDYISRAFSLRRSAASAAA